ncbi:MAG: hypothetical protein ABSG36_14395 [Acidimicrobiales bacterium]
MSSTLVAPRVHSAPQEQFGEPSLPRSLPRTSRGANGSGGRLCFLAVSLVALVVMAVLGWNISGGRFVVMETPSMCPAVCVGSLVADRPLQARLRVGELITFHPSTTSKQTYTHEISRIFANGAIQTRGVANPGPDPWLITRSDIIGEVTFTLWGLGWLLKILPLLAVGVLAWVMVRPRIARRSRRAWDRLWITLLVVIPFWLLHPLVRATLISTTGDPSHKAWLRAKVVNTGILPASFHAAGGQYVAHVMAAGITQVAGPPSEGRYLVMREAASLQWWGWTMVIALVILPLAGYLWHIWRGDETEPEAVPT